MFQVEIYECFNMITNFEVLLNNLIMFLVLFVSLSTVLLSGERVSLFYTIIFLIILFIFTNFKFKLIYFFSIIIISFIFISNFPTLKKRFFDQTFDQVLSSYNQEKRIIFFSIQHESHAISALKMFYDRPILGVGPKNFRNACKCRRTRFWRCKRY